MEKYKELFKYSQDVFKQELDRFMELDKKAAQYLSTLTIFIGVAGFFVKWIFDNFVPAQSNIEILLIVLAVLILITLLIAWFYIFSVLKMQEIYKLPLDLETLEFFKDNKDVDVYYSMSKGMASKLSYNREVGDKKSTKLIRGYNTILITVILLSIFSILFGYYKWNKPNSTTKGVQIMSEENNQQNPNSQPPEPPDNSTDEPNPDIEPPKFPKVTHGETPIGTRDPEPDKITMDKVD